MGKHSFSKIAFPLCLSVFLLLSFEVLLEKTLIEETILKGLNFK